VLRLNAASDSIFASFNLSTGAVGTTVNAGTGSGATATIQNAGNGWYRCTLSGIFSSTSANPIAIIYPAVSTADPSGTSIVYTGNGTSGLFIWGAQLEAGAFPTSYIPTTTTLFIVQISGKAASVNAFTAGVNAGRVDATASFVANTTTKAAYAYALNDRAVTTGGSVPTTSATVYTIPTVTLMRLGTQGSGFSQINGYLRRVSFFPRRLSNAELQALTV